MTKTLFSLLRRLLNRVRSQGRDADPLLTDEAIGSLMEAFALRQEQLISPKRTPRKRTAKKTPSFKKPASKCPTPRKVKYASLSAAKGARGYAGNNGARMHAYRCPCGSYHLARREAP